MKKSKYLFLLRNKLLWKHSTKNINSIIFDYNEYFDIGTSNGKSIGDIVVDLGSPTEVAKVLEEEGDVWAPIKLIVRMGLALMLLFYTYVYFDNIYNEHHIIGISLMFTIITPIGIWLLTGGDLNYKRIDDVKLSLKAFKYLIVSLIATLFTAVISTILILYTADFVLTQLKLPFGIPNKSARVYFEVLFHCTTAIGLISIVQIIRYYRRTFINILPLLFAIVGVIYSVQSLINKFSLSIAPSDLFYNNELWLCMLPFLLGLVTSILSFYLVKLLDKKGR